MKIKFYIDLRNHIDRYDRSMSRLSKFLSGPFNLYSTTSAAWLKFFE